MTSITLATTPNSTGPSPRINAVREARCLKTSSSRPPSASQATGTWLMSSVPVHMNLYNNYESVPCLFDRLRRRLRNQRIQTLGVHRDDHKDHQEHQQDIDQRNNIHVRDDTPFTAYHHSHESPRFTQPQCG